MLEPKRRSNEVTRLFQSLKRLLKRQKISYFHLAAEMKMSESGVKKMFSAQDISMGKLSRICKILGFSLIDLVYEAENSRPADVQFSLEQQKFLVANTQHFRLFYKLSFERMSLAEAEKSMDLSEKESFALLKKLDELRLIELHPHGKVRVPPLKRIGKFGTGPLVEKLYRDWSLQLMRDIARPEQKENEVFIIRYFRVRPETFAEFMRSLQDIESEFVKRATREMALGGPDLIPLRWVCAADSNTFVK